MKASLNIMGMVSGRIRTVELPLIRFTSFVDTRGVEEIPKEIRTILPDIESETFRRMMVSTLDQCLDTARDEGLIEKIERHGLDGRLVFSRAADDVCHLLNNLWKLGLPLEVAIDLMDFKDSFDPTYSDEVIAFLKNDILGDYRRWFKNKRGVPLIGTFVLTTARAFSALGGGKYWLSPYEKANYFLLRTITSC